MINKNERIIQYRKYFSDNELDIPERDRPSTLYQYASKLARLISNNIPSDEPFIATLPEEKLNVDLPDNYSISYKRNYTVQYGSASEEEEAYINDYYIMSAYYIFYLKKTGTNKKAIVSCNIYYNDEGPMVFNLKEFYNKLDKGNGHLLLCYVFDILLEANVVSIDTPVKLCAGGVLNKRAGKTLIDLVNYYRHILGAEVVDLDYDFAKEEIEPDFCLNMESTIDKAKHLCRK